MNKMRRLFVFSVATVLAAMTSGCVTPAIEASHSYPESVSSILISQDKQKIVFIGKSYHYVFDAPADLVKTLGFPFHSKVNAILSNFHVDKQGAVTGLYSLQIDADVTDKEKNDAVSTGFKSDAAGQLTLAGELSGTRYRAGDLAKNAVPQKLNKAYLVNVTYEPSKGDRAAEALITPIIVSSEGLFLLFNTMLAPVLIPMGFAKISDSCFPYCMTPKR